MSHDENVTVNMYIVTMYIDIVEQTRMRAIE